MEKEIHPWQDLKILMELQIQGLKEFQTNQLQVKKALEEKSWPELERNLKALDFKADGLKCLEERRNQAWDSLRNSLGQPEADFYQLLPFLPLSIKDELAAYHRELKLLTLQVKGMTTAISTQVQMASNLIKSVIQEINPALKGNIYARNGECKPIQAQSLVVDTHF